MEWCPDQSDNAASLGSDDVSGTWVRTRFGCSPLMWHCWACLLGSKTELHEHALVADDAALWQPVLANEAAVAAGTDPKDFPFPPGPIEILSAVVSTM